MNSEKVSQVEIGRILADQRKELESARATLQENLDTKM